MRTRRLAVCLAVCFWLLSETPLQPSAASMIATEVSAASAVVMEADSGRVIFEKDAHKPRPMASTTKIMTALLAAESLDPDKTVTVTDRAVRVEGTALGLRAGYRITVRDLITGMLLVSGNDAANVLALETADSLEAFADMMNRRAAAIGMEHSHFVTPSGLDEGEHSSTAYDMALLAAEALRNSLLAPVFAMKTAAVRMGDPPVAMTVTNHNRLLELYPDAVGLKTGFTKKAGRCLVSAARRDGVTLIAVTLNAPDDWNDHIRLYNAAFETVESVSLPPVKLPALSVAGSDCDHLSLAVTPPEKVVLPRGDIDRVTVRLELPRFVWGGVKMGDPVGRASYYLDGKRLAWCPVVAAENAPEQPVAGYGVRMKRHFEALLRSFFTDTL